MKVNFSFILCKPLFNIREGFEVSREFEIILSRKGGENMDNNKKTKKGEFKVAPAVNNDQLGENNSEQSCPKSDNKEQSRK